ncbi:602_t:CDS:1 [Entrophospora sp. SA101]|nr:10649_t:CDS:1 [Entrophospora sp. SA101]CAJ0759813.1 602_t:CDS:1 [Entrophospora sp. SA101]CAJ0824133.1 7747_t:CDS:1 [Entrophospora sp. SA101]CAJ0825024.1 21105_t:CDS:1 [Entrophospora sp. SA101]CAJ0908664.1 9212_t:CDS:1 [Entrophospora sp. SA101]
MIKSFKSSIIFLVLASATLFTNALPTADTPGNEITLDTATLCTYLPPAPGGIIADHENDALPFCNTTTPPEVQGPVSLIPSGFIVSAHYLADWGYVQYTGRINRDAYQLRADDEGGQYDSVGAPPGAACVGYSYVKFVNLIEPKDGRFCIRCCSDASKCNTSESTKGCPVIVPGDYS